MSNSHTEDILFQLKKSFLEEKRDINEQITDIETHILECKEFIESLNKKDECDYSMFSPRSASRVYKDQVYDKQLDIDDSEEILRSLYKKLSTVTKKIDMVNELSPKSVEDDHKDDIHLTSDDRTLYLKLQEDDRQRIASDLHDTVLQNLSLIMHNLELASKFMDYDLVRTKLELESNRRLVKQTIDDIRSTIFDLRPMQFDDFGFKKALEDQLQNYLSRTDMNIEYHIDSLSSVDHLILISVFRIVQELVINSIKHSKGSNIFVQVLDEGHKIYIEEYDDGIGLLPASVNKDHHFGLNILKERVDVIGGTILYPIVDKGFKVIIEINY